MRLSTLFLSTGSLALIVLGAPLDSTSAVSPSNPSIPASPLAIAPESDPLVVLTVFNDAQCHEPGEVVNSTSDGRMEIGQGQQCVQLYSNTDDVTADGEDEAKMGAKWDGLQVLWAHEKLRYNSLRVYNSINCTGSWALEPIRCGTKDQACACSQIHTYNSIKLDID